MLVERLISADVALPASVPFADVPDPLAGFSFQSPLKRTQAKFFMEGSVSVTALGERLDLDILLGKDGGPAAARLSGKADGLAGFEALIATAFHHVSVAKHTELTEGTYKAKVQYKTTAGAAVIEATTHDFAWGVQFSRSVALLPQAAKPQDQLQV